MLSLATVIFLVVTTNASDEEVEKDFDMRGLARIQKHTGKKLKGSRKRKEEELAAEVSGADFKIDVKDDRFNALLDGADARFGIDRTDTSFKDTPAMKEILAEQSRRRRDGKKQKTVHDSNGNEVASVGVLELNSLVKSIKTKVKK